MKGLFCYYTILLALFIFAPIQSHSQNTTKTGITYIQQLIEHDSLQKAKTLINQRITYLKSENRNDSLVNYIALAGSFKLTNNDSGIAIAKAEQLVSYIKEANNPSLSMKALLALANLHFSAREYKKDYEISEEALGFAKKTNDIQQEYISQIEYNLGTAAISLRDLELGKKHLYRSKKILETNPTIDAEQFYLAYNSIGRLKASVLELDSSNYYYNKSLKALENTEKSPVNQFYRAAIVKQNMGLNLNNSGQIEKGIKAMEEAIADFKKYIDVAEDEMRRTRAMRFRLAIIDNLGGFYSNIGDNSKAIDLMTYSYNEKRKTLLDDDPNVITSCLLLGHVNLLAKNYKDAGAFIDKGLQHIDRTPYYQDYALMVRATIYDQIGDIDNAKKTYEQSETLYREKSKNQYPLDFLDALLEMSNFYATHRIDDKALTLAKESYNYTHKPSFENELTKFYHTQNLALVNYKLKHYQDAETYSDEALSMTLKMNSKLDSIQNEMRKPLVLYINAKSKYQLNPSKNIAFLKSLLSQIENGIKILEQRKSIVSTSEDLSKLLAENVELFDFAKQLRLDLYKSTKDKTYLDDLIAIHESSIYNRIRSRLNLKGNIAFMNVPENVTKREQTLKNNISKSLNDPDDMSAYFNANTTWNTFLDSLKQDYPKYYKMRYATIEEPLTQLQKHIPKNTTIVRYMYVDSSLYAFVIDKKDKNIFKLNPINLAGNIETLRDQQVDVSGTSTILFKLYKQLWQPFENDIKTERVIIIPDRALFNLSFEMLTPKLAKSYRELTTNSLLSKYVISYNYSLFLIDKNRKTIDYKNNFVAFAPEFNDKMKTEYKIAIHDSLDLDRTYLILLPQPFTKDLAQKSTRLFKGTSFLNEKSTKHIFEKSAKEHKIIHIGTHAESNNVSPELSRLVFAKSLDSTNTDDNYLYTYEIYNTNLSSNLAILTACETGKPSYQAGEGMISLANAFNYAGSESILTSLWKIDEQSSAEIVGEFYKNIKKGWPKDKALQQAKLTYISKAEGRTINPEYWAGLVLIGDTALIDISTSQPLWLILLVAVSTIGFIWFMFSKRRNRSN